MRAMSEKVRLSDGSERANGECVASTEVSYAVLESDDIPDDWVAGGCCIAGCESENNRGSNGDARPEREMWWDCPHDAQAAY